MSGSWSNAGSPTGSTSVTIPSLQPATEYDLEVVATDPAGSVTSAVITATTASGVPPTSATNLTIAGFSSAGTVFSWTASGGSTPITYQLQYRATGTAAWTNIGSATTDTSITIQGLTGGTTYNFQVVSTNGFGSITSPIFALTVPTGIAPSAPFGLSASGITATSATISWSPSSVGTSPVSYQVYYRKSASVTVPPPPPPPTVTPPGSVSGIATPTNPTSSSIQITWVAPTTGTGPFTYNVGYRASGAQTFTSAATGLTTRSETLSGLQPGTSYTVEVQAVDATGLAGAWTVAGPWTTLATSATAMNALDMTPTLALSNSALTVSSTVTGPQSVRASRSVGSGLVYFEAVINRPTSNLQIGIATDRYNLQQPFGLGSEPLDPENTAWTSCGYEPSSAFLPGQILINNDRLVSNYTVSWGHATNTANATVGVAIDFNNWMIWYTSDGMQADGNAWNNMPLTQANPATGVGGVPIQFLYPGPFFAVCWTKDANSQATFNFGAAGFKFGLPTGFTAYNDASNPYTAPLTTVPAPSSLSNSAPTTDTAIPVAWAAVTNATSYNLEVYIGPNAVDSFLPFIWNQVYSGPSTSCTVSIPASTNPYYFWFRVQAVTAAGPGLWTVPQIIISQPTGYGPTVGQVEDFDFYPDTVSGNTITFAKKPYPADDINAAGQTYYLTLFAPASPANLFLAEQDGITEAIPNYTFNGFSFMTGNTKGTAQIIYPDSHVTMASLSPNTEYQYWLMLFQTGSSGTDTSPPNYLGQHYGPFYTSLPATGGYSGGLTERLIPPGAEPVTWELKVFPMKPMGATAHFAVHYDVTVLSDATAANIWPTIQAGVETIYNQCVNWFGSQSNHGPSIKTSINPDGSLVNVFIASHQGFGGAHNGCNNADIMISTINATDLANVSVLLMLIAAELTEVFMPNLQSLPDCDQHALGEGLSVAMAVELFPNAWTNSSTAAPVVADYINAKWESDSSDYLKVRVDYTDQNPEGETIQQFDCIGFYALFFSYLVHQLGYSYTQICGVLNQLPAWSTGLALYQKLTGKTDSPYNDFAGRLNSKYPLGTVVPDNTTPNPWPISTVGSVPPTTLSPPPPPPPPPPSSGFPSLTPFTPQTPPSEPTGPTVAIPTGPNSPSNMLRSPSSAFTPTSMTITWDPPSSGGSYTYLVSWRVHGWTNFTKWVPVSGTTYTFTGLTPATAYDFQIASVDPNGIISRPFANGPWITAAVSSPNSATSQNGTQIVNVGQQIIDSLGYVYQLEPQGTSNTFKVCNVEGVPDTTISSVAAVTYSNGQVWYEDLFVNQFVRTTPANAWVRVNNVNGFPCLQGYYSSTSFTFIDPAPTYQS